LLYVSLYVKRIIVGLQKLPQQTLSDLHIGPLVEK